jgi:hypothetical protein
MFLSVCAMETSPPICPCSLPFVTGRLMVNYPRNDVLADYSFVILHFILIVDL